MPHRVHDPAIDKQQKRALWDEIIQDFLSSGLSYRDYSEQHGLNYDLLNYYVRAYQRKRQHAQADFVPVAVATAQSAPQSAHPMTLSLGIYRIDIAEPSQVHWLSQLLPLLEARLCSV